VSEASGERRPARPLPAVAHPAAPAPGEARSGPGADPRPVPYLDMPVSEFLRALSAARPEPAGGSAAALTVALAAGLCAMTADFSARQFPSDATPPNPPTHAAPRTDAQPPNPATHARQTPGRAASPAHTQPPNPATHARQLRDRAAALAQADAEAYRAVMAARRARDGSVDYALSAASAVPLEVAEIGARLAALAALIAERGNPNVRGDAIAAALLAAAGAKAAAELVRINLRRAPGDSRPEQAQKLAAEAARHATAATVAP
jgi:methenyltetrahydrofolate cyclohydrolase